MTAHQAATPGLTSRLMIGVSLTVVLAVSLATDLFLLADPRPEPLGVWVAIVLLNATVVLLALVGAAIEWRRAGHAIGRLLLLAGPLYALLAASWFTGEQLAATIQPAVGDALGWAGALLSYAGIALIAGWIPLLFPTGSLPSPRWRLPVLVASAVLLVGTLAWSVRPGRLIEDVDLDNPYVLEGWPAPLQLLVDAIPIAAFSLIAMAVIGLVVRYRRGDIVERLQIRWLTAAVALIAVGAVAAPTESSIRQDDGPSVSALIIYAGILAMPIAIGIAILRYRLYEIDRIISRTLGWALVTGVLVAVFAGLVVGLQALLAGVTQGQTLAVAASTLVAFALFQPVRRRVQRAVDHRFDRARYDGERTAQAFAERLRGEVDIETVADDLRTTVEAAIKPTNLGLWLREAPP